jgi:Zn-dependent protease with chaperone function
VIDAIYFDGKSTRRHAVTVIIHKRIIAIRGEGVRRSERVSRLDISERLQHAPRLLRFADGACLEVADGALDKMLRANRFFDPRVVRWQHNWPASLLALVGVLAMLVSAYQWGMPFAAERIAMQVPAAYEKTLGDKELALMDGAMVGPSTLAQSDQDRLRQLFGALKRPAGARHAVRIEFRTSHVGPNAFALPNGAIVLTDQMVRLAHDDQAVLGVLAHELGHVERRHALRGIVQTAGVGAMLNAWVGDVSSVLAAFPTLLLDQKYSRDFEREADQYAIDMMRLNGASLEPMAELFEKFEAIRSGMAVADDGADEAPQPDVRRRRPDDARRTRDIADYLSSHPSDAERIARLRAASGG